MSFSESTKAALSANELSDLSQTSLLTLLCRASDATSARPSIVDPKAVEVVEMLRPALMKSNESRVRKWAAGEISPFLVRGIARRAQWFDERVRCYLAAHPGSTVVNLGAGLDARFERVDDGKVQFFDIDLEPVTKLREKLFEPNARRTHLSASVLDNEWISIIKEHSHEGVIFVAEGLFMYLPPLAVRRLVLTLRREFTGAELVCEVFSKQLLKRRFAWIVRRRLRRIGIDGDARFLFGLSHSEEMESWGPGIKFLRDWTYFDESRGLIEKVTQPGMSRLMRKIIWSVHYRLG